MTKYITELNNFLIKSASLKTDKTISLRVSDMKIIIFEDFLDNISRLYAFNEESKIEVYLKKRKNINMDIYNKIKARSSIFYEFFEYATGCYSTCNSFI